MNWLVWIIFGALAGWIASMIMGTNRQMGALANIVVGILGALIGGFLLSSVFGVSVENAFNIPNLLVAIGGAVILLFLARLVRRT